MQRPIEVSTSIRVPFAQVLEVLSDDPRELFGDAGSVGVPQDLPTRTVLSVDLGAGTSVHQEVLVDLGGSHSTETGLGLPVTWQATGRKRLFPTFTGELDVSEADEGTRLRLRGTYNVPLGVIGRAGDGVVGWRLARRSLDALLARLGQQLDTEVDRRLLPMSERPTPGPAAPKWERSEIYIG